MQQGKRKKGKNKNCLACGKEFYIPAYRVEKAKFCSVFCLNHTQHETIEKICVGCDKPFFVSNSRVKQKFCNRNCKSIKIQSEKDRRKASKVWSLNNRSPGRTIRNFIFKVKPKKCEICNYEEHDFCLDIHHKDMNSSNNTIENLIVLCAFCHRKVHKNIIQL